MRLRYGLALALLSVLVASVDTQERFASGKGLKAHDSSVIATAVSADGSFVATAGWSEIKLWSLPDLAPGPVWQKFATRALAVAFSPDFKTAAAALEDGSIGLWSVPGGQLIGSWQSRQPGEPARRIESLLFVDDGKRLVSGDGYSAARVWSLPQGQLQRTFEHRTGTVHSLATTTVAGGLLITASGTLREIHLWPLTAGGSTPASLTGHAQYLQSLATTPDGLSLVSSSNTELKLWSLRDNRLTAGVDSPRQPDIAPSRGAASVISRDGRWLASVEIESRQVEDRRRGTTRTVEDHYVVLRQLPELRSIAQLRVQDRVASLAFSPDASMLIAGDRFGLVFRWDLAKMGIHPK